MSHDRPWFREYEAYGIEETLEPYPDHPVHRFLYDAAEEFPEQGVVQGDRTVTYEELAADVDALAAALQARGVGAGDRVATVLPTSAQSVVATNAISRAGGVDVPNDFLDSEEDLVHRLGRGDPGVLVGHDAHREQLETLREEAGVEHLILTTLADYGEDPPSHDPVDGAEWLPDVIADSDGALIGGRREGHYAVRAPRSTAQRRREKGGRGDRPRQCVARIEIRKWFHRVNW